jgi:hypothetical protein
MLYNEDVVLWSSQILYIFALCAGKITILDIVHATQVCIFFIFFYFFLINIYFQEAFSQSDFQKGPELNKEISYKEDMHILHSYEKY